MLDEGILNVMFYSYVKHNITPDEFAKKNRFTQFLISLFNEKESKLEQEAMNKNK